MPLQPIRSQGTDINQSQNQVPHTIENMCARFDPVIRPERFKQVFGTGMPAQPTTGLAKALDATEVFPGGFVPIIRATTHGLSSGHIEADLDPPGHEAAWAMFGLLPPWAKDTKLCRSTYNARTETVADKPSFRDAWVAHRHCIVPAEAITEPGYSSGKAVPTRIACADGLPMGIAGLWSRWKAPDGHPMDSFTMLTINADSHPLMNRFHKPGEEKRMVVILPRSRWKDWLLATPARMLVSQRQGLLRAYPAERMAII